LIDDTDYSAPQDHYFGFINRRQGETQEERKSHELEILKGLDLSSVISGDTQDIIYSLKEEPEVIQHNFFSSQTGSPRHSKQDYEEMSKRSFNEIFQDIAANKMKK
jgi:hypothetical protein